MLPARILMRKLALDKERVKREFPEARMEVRSLWRRERGTVIPLPGTYSATTAEVVEICDVRGLRAAGYELVEGQVRPRLSHDVRIYVMRWYPFLSERKGCPPVHVVQLSDIFHPNITPGIEAEGPGSVDVGYWRRIHKSHAPLLATLRAYKRLVESPNPFDPMPHPTCLAAAEWFRARGKLKRHR